MHQDTALVGHKSQRGDPCDQDGWNILVALNTTVTPADSTNHLPLWTAAVVWTGQTHFLLPNYGDKNTEQNNVMKKPNTSPLHLFKSRSSFFIENDIWIITYAQTPLASCSLQNTVQSGHSNVRCLSPSQSSILSQPCYFHHVRLRQDPAQICCHSQDEDEPWQSCFIHFWTYCVEQFTIWTLAHRLLFYASSMAEVTVLSISF